MGLRIELGRSNPVKVLTIARLNGLLKAGAIGLGLEASRFFAAFVCAAWSVFGSYILWFIVRCSE